jgi:hypothetical protein
LAATHEAPSPLAIVYPARFLLDQGGHRPAPDRLAAAVRAVGDPIRLDVLRLVAERPRSNEELAPLVGLSESGSPATSGCSPTRAT